MGGHGGRSLAACCFPPGGIQGQARGHPSFSGPGACRAGMHGAVLQPGGRVPCRQASRAGAHGAAPPPPAALPPRQTAWHRSEGDAPGELSRTCGHVFACCTASGAAGCRLGTPVNARACLHASGWPYWRLAEGARAPARRRTAPLPNTCAAAQYARRCRSGAGASCAAATRGSTAPGGAHAALPAWGAARADAAAAAAAGAAGDESMRLKPC